MAKKKEEYQVASFGQDDLSAGGFLDNGDEGLMANCEFRIWDDDGKRAGEEVLTMFYSEVGDIGEVSWLVGAAADWLPIENGDKLARVGQREKIWARAPFGMLIGSLYNTGMPNSYLTDAKNTASAFNGINAKWQQVESGGTRTGRDGKEYKRTTPIIQEIIDAPWNKKSGKSTGSKSAGSKKKTESKKTEAANVDVDAKTVEVIVGLVAEAGGQMPKKEIPGKLYQAMVAATGDNQAAVAAVQSIGDDAFFTAAGGLTISEGIVSLG